MPSLNERGIREARLARCEHASITSAWPPHTDGTATLWKEPYC
jgi:hypothetical protein